MKLFSYAVFSSVCALIVGVLLVAWPGQSINFLVMIVGVLFLLPGVFGIISYFLNARKRQEEGVKMAFPIVALGSTLLGLWLISMPGFFTTALMYVLGVMLILAGSSQLANLAVARSTAHVPWGLYLVPVLVLIAGLVVLFNPFQTLEMAFKVLGIFCIIYAVMDLFRLFKFRKQTVEAVEVEEVEPDKERIE